MYNVRLPNAVTEKNRYTTQKAEIDLLLIYDFYTHLQIGIDFFSPLDYNT